MVRFQRRWPVLIVLWIGWAAAVYAASFGMLGVTAQDIMKPFDISLYNKWFRRSVAYSPLLVLLGGHWLIGRRRSLHP